MTTHRPFAPSRRAVVAGALALAGCGGAPGARSAAPAAAAPRVVADPGWSAWVAACRPRATAAGIRPATFEAAFRGAGLVPEAIERDRAQAEFRRSLEDYLALVASEERVREGRAAFGRRRATFAAVERRFGVPGPIVAAIWGIESRYGARRGTFPVVSALSTLAFDGRRGRFFEAQLVAALRILQAGDVAPAGLVGSWAGAMGHTQFIPTSYLAYAVDFTGDGRRDIWGEDPADALASTAAYLARSGWRAGEPWGGEGGSAAAAGGRTLRPDANGPAFGVRANFAAIKRYNNSDLYALAVGILSDRIAGGGPLRAGFGPDRYGLTQEDRRALQRGLAAQGYDVGEPDGVLGRRTFAAVEAFQRRAGLPVTGEPSPELLARLR